MDEEDAEELRNSDESKDRQGSWNDARRGEIRVPPTRRPSLDEAATGSMPSSRPQSVSLLFRRCRRSNALETHDISWRTRAKFFSKKIIRGSHE